jgi:poly-beta-hydroxyalkanoate depolymerase
MLTVFDLKNLADTSNKFSGIYKHALNYGDQVYLKTFNSVYIIKVLNGGEYLVSGGWFDRQKLSPHKINIRGCTWGGTAIKTDIIAAPGLCIEFGNNLITSRIHKVFYFSHNSIN